MSREERTAELGSKVMDIELLREQILDYVIHTGDKMSIPDITTCRLVHSSWQKTVSKCLRRARLPLFTLKFPPPYFEKKSLQNFHLLRENCLQRDGIPPTMAMVVPENYIKDEGFQEVEDHLKCYKSDLVSLRLLLPSKGTPRLAKIDALHLPLLQKLSVGWQPGRMHNDDYSRFDHNSYTASFIQHILTGSPNLKQFALLGRIMNHTTNIAPFFEKLCLPGTLTTLSLNRDLTKIDLLALSSSRLPKLTTLQLACGYSPSLPGRFPELLLSLSPTLKNLILRGVPNGSIYDPNLEISGGMTLPRLKFLESFEVAGKNIRLENMSPFEFPALKKVKLSPKNIVIFESSRWMQWQFLESFDIDLGCVNISKYFLPAFCPYILNLSKLSITLDTPSTNAFAVKYLVGNWKELKVLRVHVRNVYQHSYVSGPRSMIDGNGWIALIHGITQMYTVGLQITDTFLNTMKPKLDKDFEPAILTKLQKLYLKYDHCMGEGLPFDEAFDLGFTHLPDMKEISLKGNFQVSKTTVENWQKDGRLIEIS